MVIQRLDRGDSCGCLGGGGYHIQTLDIYATWVGLARVLNEWVVRVHVKGEPDRSREAVERVLCSLDLSRPGVRYTVDRYRRGVSRGR